MCISSFSNCIVGPKDPTAAADDLFSGYKKAVMKTRGPGKIPREDAILVQGVRNTAGDDTTSEPRGRNATPGAPVKASMSDGASRNQGGTVEYFVSHPCFVRGWEFFIPSPSLPLRGGGPKGRRGHRRADRICKGGYYPPAILQRKMISTQAIIPILVPCRIRAPFRSSNLLQ